MLITNQRGFVDRVDIGVERCDVDEMQQQPGALQVTQELMAKARALGCSFYKARDIGNNEASILIDANHAQVRM